MRQQRLWKQHLLVAGFVVANLAGFARIEANATGIQAEPVASPVVAVDTGQERPRDPTLTLPTPNVADVEKAETPNMFLVCVRHRESRGDYTVVNPRSGAAGAYQFMQVTWDATARHIDRFDLVGIRPHLTSPATQDMMASELYRWQGTAPWVGPGC